MKEILKFHCIKCEVEFEVLEEEFEMMERLGIEPLTCRACTLKEV